MDYKFKLDDAYISSGLVYGFKIFDYNHATSSKSFEESLKYELDKVYPHNITDALIMTGSRGVKIFKDGITVFKNENMSVLIGVPVSIDNAKNITVDPALRNIVDDYAGAAHSTAGYHVITTAE